MIEDTNEMRSGTGKIMSFVVPLCLIWLLMENCSPTLVKSLNLDFGMKGLKNTTVKISRFRLGHSVTRLTRWE